MTQQPDIYQQNLDHMARLKPRLYQAALTLCESIAEPNTLSVCRLIELFGMAQVETTAAEAHRLHAAYPEGTTVPAEQQKVVLTGLGQPRAVGGIFFQLMQNHAISIGLDWDALRLPFRSTPRQARPGKKMSEGAGTTTTPPDAVEPTTPAKPFTATLPPPAVTDQAATTAPPAPVVAATTTPPPPPASTAPATPAPTPATSTKPSRAKLTVVGVPIGPPTTVESKAGPVLQLVFKCEMNSSLPKGLRVLGPTVAAVWCTPKQWAKVEPGLTPTTPLIAEGEGTTAHAGGLPILRLVCTSLRGLETGDADKG